MTVKEQLHRVVDELSDEQAEAALRRIDAMRSDPLVRYMDSVPLDEEPVTSEEEAAIAEIEAEQAAGAERVSFDEIKRTYG